MDCDDNQIVAGHDNFQSVSPSQATVLTLASHNLDYFVVYFTSCGYNFYEDPIITLIDAQIKIIRPGSRSKRKIVVGRPERKIVKCGGWIYCDRSSIILQYFRFRMCLNFSTTSGRERTRSTSKLWTERAEQADRPPLRTSVREHQTGIESKQI